MTNPQIHVWHQEFLGDKKSQAEKLTRIELSETIVKQLTKIKQVRVRDLGWPVAKIEVEKELDFFI